MTINRLISNQGTNVYGTAQGIRRIVPPSGSSIDRNRGAGSANHGNQNIQGLWTPSEVAVQNWWDPSDANVLNMTGSALTGITDKGSRGFTLDSVNNTAKTGTKTKNGFNVIEMATGDWFRLADTDITNTSGNIVFHLFCRIDVVDHTADSILAWNDDIDFQVEANNNLQFDGEVNWVGNANIVMAGGPFNDGDYHLFSLVCDFDITTQEIFVDGVSKGTANYTQKLTNTGNLDFRIFANRGGAQFPTGRVSEAIIIEQCDTACRQNIEGYIMNKYGVNSQFASDHPYQSGPPLV